MEETRNISHDVLIRIRSFLSSLKPAEQRTAEYVIDNATEVIHLSITKLAEKVGVSEATVVKFCQKIGYSGYQELKIFLAASIKNKDNEEHIYDDIAAGDSTETIINKIFQIYSGSFSDTKKMLKNSELNECVSMLLESKRIFFFGYGASGIVALDGELKFKRIGYNTEALTDNHSQKTVASLLSKKDLVIAISDSGRTKELIESLVIVKKSGANIIAITSNLGSPITNYSDQILLNSSKETSFRGSALASRMSQMAVIDMLFLGVSTAVFDKISINLSKTREAIKTSKI